MAKVTYATVEQAYAEKEAAIDKNKKAAALTYDAQRADLADTATDSLQQAYLQRNRARENMAQQNRAAGITGGAAEANLLELEAGYNTTRTDTIINRDKQIGQVDIAQMQSEAQADMEKASDRVSLATGKLSFEQDQESTARSDAFEMAKAGIITDEIAATLGWPKSVLQTWYERLYKKEDA